MAHLDSPGVPSVRKTPNSEFENGKPPSLSRFWGMLEILRGCKRIRSRPLWHAS